MNRKLYIAAFLCALFLSSAAHALTCGAEGSGSSSGSFALEGKLIGAGGGRADSENFAIHSAIGQPTENKSLSSENYILFSGIINTIGGIQGSSPNIPAGNCSGSFSVFTLADYDAYVAADFGRNGGSNYQNLVLEQSLSGVNIDIASPCGISIVPGISINADTVVLEGVQEIIFDDSVSINAGEVCLHSSEGGIETGAGLVVVADNFTLDSQDLSEIGDSASLQISEALTIKSHGDNASFDNNASIDAGSIEIIALKDAFIESSAFVQATQGILLQSELKNHSAFIRSDSIISATDLTLTALGNVFLGERTQVTVALDLELISLGSANASGNASIERDATIAVNGDMSLASQKKSIIKQGVTIIVANDIAMDAASASASRCVVNNQASITYVTKSGVCQNFLP